MKSCLFIGIFTLLVCSCGKPEPVVQADVGGIWDGGLVVAGTTLEISVQLSQTDSTLAGKIEIPVQNVRGLELIGIDVRGDSVFFSIPSGLGRADFLGTVRGDSMSGAFVQSGYTGSYTLLRTSRDIPLSVSTGEEVVIRGDDCELAGTLDLPQGEPPYPCVFLLTGSGQQDRDEYVMGFPVFAVLSRHLTDAGLAVLRCDDRGVGGSTGGMEAFNDSVLLYEANLMLDFLRQDGRIDPSRIGVLGHSEGSSTAFALAAGRPSDIAFVVSMAGPALDGYTTILAQQAAILRTQGFPEEEIVRRQAVQTGIMDAVLAGADSTELESILDRQFRSEFAGLTEEELAMMGDVEGQIRMMVDQALAQVTSEWFESFLVNDPAINIRSVTCPVLVLSGGKDIQVPRDLNLPHMESALEDNPDHETVVFDDANHLFQQSVTGAVEEYATLEPAFIEGFPEAVTGWISERVF
ncbi:MAG: alpha/beta fold hydrolase [Candidatus Fermentibacteraceae bacterium]